jgi:hypothetical protein
MTDELTNNEVIVYDARYIASKYGLKLFIKDLNIFKTVTKETLTENQIKNIVLEYYENERQYQIYTHVKKMISQIKMILE